jgi:hypothetical protein
LYVALEWAYTPVHEGVSRVFRDRQRMPKPFDRMKPGQGRVDRHSMEDRLASFEKQDQGERLLVELKAKRRSAE